MQLKGYVSSVGKIIEANNKRKENKQKVVTKYTLLLSYQKSRKEGVASNPYERIIPKEIEDGERRCTLKKINSHLMEKTQTLHREPTQILSCLQSCRLASWNISI